MAPAAQANLYCSASDITFLLSQLGVDARLDDGDAATLLAQAINYATGKVKLYCLEHYDDADLATSWLVNEWATVIAAHLVCLRRGNPVPASLQALLFGSSDSYGRAVAGRGGVMGDLADVRSKAAQIPDIGYRNVPWPAYSNVTVDPRYRVKQIRVQRPISDPTPTTYPQAPDYWSEGIGPGEG